MNNRYFFSFLGSKKSAPIRLVKEASEAVETLDGIPVRNSSLNASVNIESLCHELEQQPNLLQVFLLENSYTEDVLCFF